MVYALLGCPPLSYLACINIWSHTTRRKGRSEREGMIRGQRGHNQRYIQPKLGSYNEKRRGPWEHSTSQHNHCCL